MFAYVHYPFPTYRFLLYYVVVFAAALGIDRLFRRRLLLVNIFLALAAGISFLYCSQWIGRRHSPWQLFTEAWRSWFGPHYYWEWSDYVLAVPAVLCWVVFPLYFSSIVVRAYRSLQEAQPGTAPNGGPAAPSDDSDGPGEGRRR